MPDRSGSPEEKSSTPVTAGGRLHFIDLARTVAILMMLEGHFVDVTLADAWRGNFLYSVWHHFRGLAAPMFFASTGLVFVFLLTGSPPGTPVMRLTRVKKGLARAAELLGWGYLLQIDLRHLPGYFRDGPDAWFGAFHVLQCIAAGLLILIGIYALHRRIRRIPLEILYLLAVAGLSVLNLFLRSLPEGTYFPPSVPGVLQNPLHGPYSVFPVTPWLIFTLYGAIAGSLVRKFQPTIHRWWLPAVILGLILKSAGSFLDGALIQVASALSGTTVKGDVWLHHRVGEILTLFGILIFVDSRFRLAGTWLVKVGRNTLPIYILHVILLYGGIFGIGLKSWIARALSPWQATFGAILFMGLFVALALAIDEISNRRRKKLRPGGPQPPPEPT